MLNSFIKLTNLFQFENCFVKIWENFDQIFSTISLTTPSSDDLLIWKTKQTHTKKRNYLSRTCQTAWSRFKSINGWETRPLSLRKGCKIISKAVRIHQSIARAVIFHTGGRTMAQWWTIPWQVNPRVCWWLIREVKKTTQKNI